MPPVPGTYRTAGSASRLPRSALRIRDRPSRLDALQIPALHRAGVCASHRVHASLRGVFHDQCTRADHEARADRHTVTERCIDADEGLLTDRHVAGDHDVRRDEAMVLDVRVVADVVPAPENDVNADAHERLDDVRLEDKAVVAELDLVDVKQLGVDVADELVAVPFALVVEPAP